MSLAAATRLAATAAAASLLAGVAPADPQAPAATDAPVSAVVTVADYRYDDILWENDRTAHRIYGHALEAVEPPSGSGIDAWGKGVRRPYMDRQLRTGDQHANHGEGLDFYDVGGSRGAGGLGVWHDNKLWTSRNWRSYEILASGGSTAAFRVEYAPWPVDTGRAVAESRTFTLPLGVNFTRMVSTLTSNTADPLLVGIGIAHRRGANERGFTEVAPGRLSYWGPEIPGKGRMAIALIVDPSAFKGVVQDADNRLVLVQAQPGEPFVYYMGAAWDQGLDFKTREAWEGYVRNQSVSFDPHASCDQANSPCW